MESLDTKPLEPEPKVGTPLDRPVTVVIGFAIIFLLFLAFSTTRARSPEGAADLEEKAAAGRTVVELARTVARFGNVHGRLPKAFDELVPDFLAKIPLDPYGRSYKLISNGSDQAYVYYYGKDGMSKGYVERDQDIAALVKREGKQFVTK